MQQPSDLIPDRSLADYWMVIYRRRYAILVVVLAAIASSILISDRLPPRYEAEATFYVPEDVTNPSNERDLPGVRMPTGDRDGARAYSAILKGRNTIARMHELFPQKPIGAIRRDFDLLVNRTSLISVFVRDKDPQLAADMANAFIDQFNEYLAGVGSEDDRDTLLRAESELAALERDLESAMKQRRDLQERHNSLSLDLGLEDVERRRDQFENELFNARVALNEIQRRVETTRDQLAKESNLYRQGDIIVTTPMIESLQEQIASLEVELAGRGTNQTAGHAEMIALRRERESARALLQKEMQHIVESESKLPNSLYESLRQKLADYTAEEQAVLVRVTELASIVADLNGRLNDTRRVVSEITRIDQAMETLSKTKEAILETLNNLRKRNLFERKAAAVVQRAEPPVRPVFPNMVLNTIVAGAFGLLSGIFYAFFLGYLEDQRLIKKLKEVEEEDWSKQLAVEFPPPRIQETR